MRLVAVLLLLLAVAAAWLAFAPGDDGERRGEPRLRDAPEGRRDRESRDRSLRPARCPADLDNCAEATGRVIAVEAVDPDGDGDAHYVLAGGSITAPGISVVDVSKELRPRRLPRIGDQVTAAGPVYTGSYGQRQIEAIEVRHRRR